jgi:hypothetical protein
MMDEGPEIRGGGDVTEYAKFDAAVKAAVADAEGERNLVFESLVKGDGDIIGLVAYSIYKQNKHDWLVAFGKAKGREPQEAELSAYILGESTPRRLAIYRHLAAATIEGRGPEVSAETSPDASSARNYAIAQRHRAIVPVNSDTKTGTVIGFVALAVVALVAIYLAARYGLPGITPAHS